MAPAIETFIKGETSERKEIGKVEAITDEGRGSISDPLTEIKGDDFLAGVLHAFAKTSEVGDSVRIYAEGSEPLIIDGKEITHKQPLVITHSDFAVEPSLKVISS